MRDANSPEFRRLAVDVTIQAGLGRFFAAKFRAGVLYAIYERSLYPPALEAALKANRAARAAWAEFAEQAKGIYVPDITFGPDYFQRGHWLDRLPAMDEDIADMESLLGRAPNLGAASPKVDPNTAETAMRKALARERHDGNPVPAGFHVPPASFRRGEALAIVAHAPDAAGVWLRYRRINQAEDWQMIGMARTGAQYRAEIPAAYTDSPFPLQYRFQIHGDLDRVWVHPGLAHCWRGQPYFFARQS